MPTIRMTDRYLSPITTVEEILSKFVVEVDNQTYPLTDYVFRVTRERNTMLAALKEIAIQAGTGEETLASSYIYEIVAPVLAEFKEKNAPHQK